MPWSEAEFVQEASQAKRPRTLPAVLPEPFQETLRFISLKCPAEVSLARSRKLKEWVHLAESLKGEEEKLKASLHPDVRSIVESKKIALWRALLKKANYADMGVVAEVTNGVSLVGEAPLTTMFVPRF